MKRKYLISPYFFANRTARPSRNPLTRMRNHRRVNGPSLLLKNTLRGFKAIDINVVKNHKMYNLNSVPLWIPAGDLSSLSKI